MQYPRRRSRSRAGRAAVAVLAACSLAACTCNGPSPATQPPQPLLIVGMDGLEWRVLLELIAAGEAPTFARLLDEGTAGHLETIEPTFSPIIWTTMATGKPMREHGILGFAHGGRADAGRRMRRGGKGRPPGPRPRPKAPAASAVTAVVAADAQLYTNLDRRAAAFWNVLSAHQRSVDVVGWWMTYPVEPIRGVMIAQANTEQQTDAEARMAGDVIIKGSVIAGLPGQVHPPSREPRAMAVAADVQANLDGIVADIFGPVPATMTELGRSLWDASLWSFRADAIYLRLTQELLQRGEHSDVTAVYLGGSDIVGHRFWRYRYPGEYDYPPTAPEATFFADVIGAYYRHLDRELGKLIAALPEGGAVWVVSDHGMHAINTDGRFDPHDPPQRVASGHHPDAPAGVFAAWGGPFVQRPPASGRAAVPGDLPTIGSVYDVLPTLAALYGIPVAGDLRGQVLHELVAPDYWDTHPVASGPRYRFTPVRAAPATAAAAGPDEAERLEQLRALGYLQ